MLRADKEMPNKAEWAPCDYAVPLVSRDKVCQWHLERPTLPVPESVIELNPAKPLKKNSFAMRVLAVEKDMIPGVGNVVFVEPGRVKTGDVAAVIESHNSITLIAVKTDAAGACFAEAAMNSLRTDIAHDQIVGRVVGSI